MSDERTEARENVLYAREDAGFDAFRRDLAANLPRLLSRALETYKRFSAAPVDEDAKSFAAYETVCRAALAHVHLLVRLADWARLSEGDPRCEMEDRPLRRLVEEAEAAFQGEDSED